MKDKNPKLKNNTLEEVLVEIRYKLDRDYNLLFSSLYEKLKDHYNVFENLVTPELPSPPPGFPKFIKFRIKSKDGKKLYQIGNDIFAVNSLNYESFELFLKDLLKIINLHKEQSGLKFLNHVMLRYINKIEVDRNISDIFNISLKLPKTIEDKEVGFNHLINCKYDEDFLKISFFSKPFSQKIIKLDFSYYNKDKFPYNIEFLEKWIQKAHNNIYDAFKSSITKDYYKYLDS